MNKYTLIYSAFLVCISFLTSAQNYSDTTKVSQQKHIQKLSDDELNALRLIDSVKLAEQYRKELKKAELILTRTLTTDYFDLPSEKFIDFNYYEGLRLGLGLTSNEILSEYFTLGGYFGYGFKDEDWKYGGDLSLNIHKKSESKLHFLYSDDVAERGGYDFLEITTMHSTEFFRRFFIDKMDLAEKYQVSYNTYLFNSLKLNVFINQSYINSTDNYSYGTTLSSSENDFNFCEMGMQFKFAYNEKPNQDQETSYPVIFGNFTKGTNWFDGKYEYTKVEARISQAITSKALGKTKLTLIGGLADGNIPLQKLYNGHGSKQSFGIEAENSFGTMQPGEFYVDRFFSVFFKHEFNPFYKSTFSSPNIALSHNYGIGSLSNKENHLGINPIKSFDKGFYECGLFLNNIIHSTTIGYGFGVFYRYGPYDFTKAADNFSYKLSLTINLQPN